MQKYPSINYPKILGKIREVLRKVDANLVRVKENPYCLGIRELEQMGLYKKKYPVYATYLAAISSYPILYKVGDDVDLTASIFAKVASILSIKVLDNINDTIHGYEEAVQSLVKHEESLTNGEFTYDHSNDLVEKAENTTYHMARWTYDTLRKYVDDSQHSFALYKNDIHKYMAGQRDSFRQKVFDTYRHSLSLSEYLMKISEKGIGNIWFDIDLCIFEKKLGGISKYHNKIVQSIKTGVDFVYKSVLLYDDVSDLRDDLQQKIVNSVILYGADQGYCSLDDVEEDRNELIHRLEKANALQDVMHLGDLVFLKGMEHLHKAAEFSDGTIDLGALTFNLKILRLFTMRKWIIENKNLNNIKVSLKYFYDWGKNSSSIPAHILTYAKLFALESV